MMRLNSILSAGVFVLWIELAACSAAPKEIQSISAHVQTIDVGLQAIYRSEQEACLGKPDESACIDKVRAAFKPIIAALQDVRVAWCQLQPEDCK
jgi:hypothetical protein